VTAPGPRRAVIVGGTGMLAGVAAELVREGWHVVLPSRRYAPIPAENDIDRAVGPDGVHRQALWVEADWSQPRDLAERTGRALGGPADNDIDRAVGPDGVHRQALWVEADWSQPRDLAERTGRALGGPADLLVGWVHREHRGPVLAALGPLLRPAAPVVEVHGSAAADPLGGRPDPSLPGHPTQQVVLGFLPTERGTRWLTHAEIVEGVLDAVRRAVDGKAPAVHQVGQFRSWPAHT
jgi:hypothetical protein